MPSALLPLAAAALLVMAAAGEPSAQEPAASASTAASARRNVLTPEGWTASDRGDAYAMLSRNRPTWLRARDRSRGAVRSVVIVYLNGSWLGGVETLRQIQTSAIARIEYMNGLDATTRFGTNHDAGAILVTTR